MAAKSQDRWMDAPTKMADQVRPGDVVVFGMPVASVELNGADVVIGFDDPATGRRTFSRFKATDGVPVMTPEA